MVFMAASTAASLMPCLAKLSTMRLRTAPDSMPNPLGAALAAAFNLLTGTAAGFLLPFKAVASVEYALAAINLVAPEAEDGVGKDATGNAEDPPGMRAGKLGRRTGKFIAVRPAWVRRMHHYLALPRSGFDASNPNAHGRSNPPAAA